MTERLDAVQGQLADLRAKLERLDVLAELLGETVNDARNALADVEQNISVILKHE